MPKLYNIFQFCKSPHVWILVLQSGHMEQNNQQPQQNPQQNSTPNNSNNNQNQAPAASTPVTPAPQPQQQKPQQQPQPQKPSQGNQPKPGAVPAKQSKKNLIISGAVIIVVLALLLVVPQIKKSAPASESNGDAKTEENAGDIEGASTSSPRKTNSRSGAQSRADALATYEGKLITVSDDCEVAPETQDQTVGTTILIDNSTTSAHRVTVGTKAYTVSGLHYTLSWLNMQPGTLMITCDGKDTGSTITIK
jgi:hypothetical protein